MISGLVADLVFASDVRVENDKSTRLDVDSSARGSGDDFNCRPSSESVALVKEHSRHTSKKKKKEKSEQSIVINHPAKHTLPSMF